MDFWRGEAYSKFFDYLDATGGFYYERWGDAPVHSLGVTLFTDKNQIHFFDDIGYEHNPYTHCPRGPGKWEKGKCACNPDRSFGAFRQYNSSLYIYDLTPWYFFSWYRLRRLFMYEAVGSHMGVNSPRWAGHHSP